MMKVHEKLAWLPVDQNDSKFLNKLRSKIIV